jgi:alpha-N-arabinofuranosidase
MAGIKFHGAIDVVISANHVYRCGNVAGIWLDWMAQGAQVTRNLLHDNTGGCGDVFCEMQHGPILFANNLFLSKHNSFHLNSQGIAFVHNLVTSSVASYTSDTRVTPFQLPHSTALAGMYPAAKGSSGDHRFYNNLFVGPCNLKVIDNAALPCFSAGNVFIEGAKASRFDTHAIIEPEFDPGVTLIQKSDGWYLQVVADKAWRNHAKTKLVTTDLLGKAQVTDCAYENADGSLVCVNTDYFGKKRDKKNPFPGPFEISNNGQQIFKVWPLASEIRPSSQ